MYPASQRAPGAFLRVGVTAVVPAVAVAAHGIAGGAMPGGTGIIVSAGIGAVLGLAPDSRRRTRTAAILTTTALLTFAQMACHWALAIGDAGHGLHTSGPVPVVLTHAVAVPLSAIALVLAATLADALTTTIRSLRPPPVTWTPARPRARRVAPALVSGPVLGGPGVRGPPVAV